MIPAEEKKIYLIQLDNALSLFNLFLIMKS